MNHIILPTRFLASILMLCLVLLDSCKESTEDDPSPTIGTISVAAPDKATKSLKFDNATEVNGPLESVTSSAILEIDKDSIFWVKGIVKRIIIKKPPSISIGSVSIYVKGSKSHFNVPMAKEEETDSISVFYFDFNPDGWELPTTFDIKIIPRKDDGSPLTDWDLPVLIEDENSSSCDFKNGRIWEWILTYRDNTIDRMAMQEDMVEGTISGCCDGDGNSFYDNCFGTSSHRTVKYNTSIMVRWDFLKFFEDGAVAGQLSEVTQNVSPQLTDFCGGTAGYKRTTVNNGYTGTYSINTSNCTLTIESLDGITEPVYASDGTKIGDFILPIYAGFGSNAVYKIVGGHFLKETRNIEGQSFSRYYEILTKQ